MKKSIIVLLAALVTINIWAKDVTPVDQLPTYYESLNNKSGANLWDAVHAVTLVGYKSLGYDGLWTAYKTTDVYPAGHARAGQIWDMYSDCEFKRQCGSSYNNECDCYNREHSIPKSWWGGTTANQGCDIFHLVPTDGKVNGMRSNYAFGEVGTASYNYDGSKLGTGKTIETKNTIAGNITVSAPDKVFEPVDEYKGDFARGYFGTLLHWTSVNMTKDNGKKMFSGTNTKEGNWGLTEYGLALLMKWHRNDPVSQKEIDRNNGIQATQGNRNPFIDYPELAEYIWGANAGQVFKIGGGGGCTKLATPDVIAIAGDEQISLSWTAIDGAASYSVTISDCKGFTTECLDEPIIGAVTTSGGICTCVISGLVNDLTYTTSVKAIASYSSCDSDIDQDQVTPSAEGPHTAIEQATQQNVQYDETARKIMYHGMLYILRGEHIYDVTGRLIK